MKTLSKGERLKLSDYVNVNDEIIVSLTVTGSQKIEYCCYGVNENGKIVDGFFIFEGKTKSPFGTVTLAAGKRNQFNMKLASVPATVKRLVFVISTDHGSLQSVSSGLVRIGKNKPALQCPFDRSILPDVATATIIEIYYKDNAWRMRFAAESLSKEHLATIRKILKKPDFTVPPAPSRPAPAPSRPAPAPPRPVPAPAGRRPAPVPSLPVPQASVPVPAGGSNTPHWNHTLAKDIHFGKIWVSCLLPSIGKQPVPAECYQALNHLFWRHLLWTFWFWVPFGAVLGWIHLMLKSFRRKYFINAILYSLVVLVPYTNGFWQVTVLAWLIGLIHCYSTFPATFRHMVESTDGRHYKPRKLEDDKYNLNTIDYKTFEQEGWQNAALPVLVNRHVYGPFKDMSAFFRRLDPWLQTPAWRETFSRYFNAIEVANHTKFLSYTLAFIAPVLLLCLLGGLWGIYEISPPEVKETLVPQIQQRIYSLCGWDLFKTVQGTGSGVSRDEALRHAKADALGNALGEKLSRTETGKSGIITISDDEGDMNQAEQESQEDYEKQVEGRISDVEVLNESQSDGLFHIIIKAKVLMNKKESTK